MMSIKSIDIQLKRGWKSRTVSRAINQALHQTERRSSYFSL